jgi:hypothetical protein
MNLNTAPTLCEFENIEEALRVNMLTNKGLSALKRILWTLKLTSINLDYNPVIVQILSILLIFLTESDAYCVVKTMIDQSQV